MKDGDHIATRMQHLAELYDYWNEGLAVMIHSERIMNSDAGKMRIEKLKHAIELLDYYLEQEYSPYNTYSSEINSLHHSSSIKGGRGTELKTMVPEREEGKDQLN